MPNELRWLYALSAKVHFESTWQMKSVSCEDCILSLDDVQRRDVRNGKDGLLEMI